VHEPSGSPAVAEFIRDNLATAVARAMPAATLGVPLDQTLREVLPRFPRDHAVGRLQDDCLTVPPRIRSCTVAIVESENGLSATKQGISIIEDFNEVSCFL
jgi:hypothetical protein